MLRDERPPFRKTLPGNPGSKESEVLGVEQLPTRRGDPHDSADPPGGQWEVAREFRRRIKNRFDAEKIEIHYPQRPLA